MATLKYRTVWISDVHLGMRARTADRVARAWPQASRYTWKASERQFPANLEPVTRKAMMSRKAAA